MISFCFGKLVAEAWLKVMEDAFLYVLLNDLKFFTDVDKGTLVPSISFD